MRKFQVLVDGTSDLQKDLRDAYMIDDCKMSFSLCDKEYKTALDWGNISPEEYYTLMEQGNRVVTGLVAIPEFESKFRKYLDQGLDVLYVACSSKLSGSVNTGRLVANELIKEYPDRKIVCFDSLRSNYAQGIMGMDAAKMALEGKNIDEAVAYLEEYRLNYQVHGTVATLVYLKRNGRIKATKAFFGNLLGVKPLILSDAKGYNYAYKKVKGRKTSLDELVAIIKERVFNPENATVFVEHAICPEDAEYVASQIRDYVKEVRVLPLGPIIGSVVGPKSVTVSFFGQKVDIATPEEE